MAPKPKVRLFALWRIALLGGSWVVISGVISPLINMGHNYSYLTYSPLITTHEPPSSQYILRRIGVKLFANLFAGPESRKL